MEPEEYVVVDSIEQTHFIIELNVVVCFNIIMIRPYLFGAVSYGPNYFAE